MDTKTTYGAYQRTPLSTTFDIALIEVWSYEDRHTVLSIKNVHYQEIPSIVFMLGNSEQYRDDSCIEITRSK